MEKSINSRFYFDYNATSPLSRKVEAFLGNGDFLFANPASLHQSGKKAKKFITETTDFLFQTFGLSKNDYQLFYHSGATEGINTIFKSWALESFKQKKKAHFIFSAVDHSCVLEQKEFLELLGHKVTFFSVDKKCDFDFHALLTLIKNAEANGEAVFVNYTYINNETGIIWPLERIAEIKAQTKALVHVDAVQLVGKIKEWRALSDKADAYTFSGHKFGSLKGIGFTFFRTEISFNPLLHGGAQQAGLRSGTENALSVYSLKLALLDVIENFNAEESALFKNGLEAKLVDYLGDKGEVVARFSSARNLNTLFLVIYGQKAELLSTKFDMMGIELSTGSACSSGIIKENRVLISMGYSADDSRASLRFSFSPFMKNSDVDAVYSKITSILKLS